MFNHNERKVRTKIFLYFRFFANLFNGVVDRDPSILLSLFPQMRARWSSGMCDHFQPFFHLDYPSSETVNWRFCSENIGDVSLPRNPVWCLSTKSKECWRIRM